jgi:purine-binding chemotaxis protein CheW
MLDPAALTEDAASAQTGKYLIFALGEEEYALEVAKAREVLPLAPITPVPGTPPYVRGVLSVHGTLTPVLDLRTAFGLPARQTPATCIIVVDSDDAQMGLIVDRVVSVIDVGPESIEAPPAFSGDTTTTAVIRGIRRDYGKVTIVLDVSLVMAPAQARALTRHSLP